jgi:hypothetical protein
VSRISECELAKFVSSVVKTGGRGENKLQRSRRWPGDRLRYMFLYLYLSIVQINSIRESKGTLQPRVSPSDLVYIILSGLPLSDGGRDNIFNRGTTPFSAVLIISEFRTNHNIIAKYIV